MAWISLLAVAASAMAGSLHEAGNTTSPRPFFLESFVIMVSFLSQSEAAIKRACMMRGEHITTMRCIHRLMHEFLQIYLCDARLEFPAQGEDSVSSSFAPLDKAFLMLDVRYSRLIRASVKRAIVTDKENVLSTRFRYIYSKICFADRLVRLIIN